MRGLNACPGFGGAVAHFIGDVQIGPKSRRREKAGNHGVEACGHGRALAGEIRADNSEVLSQFGQVPAIAAKDAHAHARPNYGIDLARNGKDQRGFAASIGAKDGDMLTGANGQVDVVEHDAIAARYVDVFESEKLVLIERGRTIAYVLLKAIHIC